MNDATFLLCILFGVCYVDVLLSYELNCISDNICEYQSISCATNESCTINCHGNRACYQSTINCPPNHDCIIYCDSDQSCANTTINCPSQNGSCLVECTQLYSCQN